MRTLPPFLVLLLVAVPAAWAQNAPAPVVVAPVIEGEVARSRSLLGTVAPVRRSTVGAEVGARVAAVRVEEGARVEAHDPLLVLDSTVLHHQLLGARAELRKRRELLRQLTNGTRPEEIEQARARLESAKAAVAFWEDKLERSEDAARQGTISDEELREVRLSSLRAAYDLDVARAELDLSLAGPRPELIRQQRADTWVQRAVVRRLEEEIRRHTIRAPFAGWVTARYAELGDWLAVGAAACDIAELDPVDVQVAVPEDAIVALGPGIEARLELLAAPDRLLYGEVVAIIPQADLRTRTFPVKVRLRNIPVGNDVLLKAGMSVQVTLPTGPPRLAVLASKDAVVLGGRSPLVWVVENDAVRAVEVELGLYRGGLVELEGELRAGMKVVVRGNERLRPGQPVTVLETLAIGGE